MTNVRGWLKFLSDQHLRSIPRSNHLPLGCEYDEDRKFLGLDDITGFGQLSYKETEIGTDRRIRARTFLSCGAAELARSSWVSCSSAKEASKHKAFIRKQVGIIGVFVEDKGYLHFGLSEAILVSLIPFFFIQGYFVLDCTTTVRLSLLGMIRLA